jgi:hypothetical protein
MFPVKYAVAQTTPARRFIPPRRVRAAGAYTPAHTTGAGTLLAAHPACILLTNGRHAVAA